MPELPEVETIVRGLRETIVGQTIEQVKLNAPPTSIVVGSSFGKKKLQQVLKDRRILDINRRGKNILIFLSGDITLWVHLKMTGHMYYLDRNEPIEKHDLAIFDFANHTGNKADDKIMHLRFNDYRRFGRLRLFKNDELWQQPGLAELGPEPLELSAEDFVTMMRSTSRMIKLALLDQSFIAGLGNIYADESLHFSKIHPKRLTNSLSPKKLTELHGHIQRLLKKSIRLMGTTVDSYSGVNGQTGRFQKYLMAYNREGEKCLQCGKARIVREKIGSRSAHYCPRCQRKSRKLVLKKKK